MIEYMSQKAECGRPGGILTLKCEAVQENVRFCWFSMRTESGDRVKGGRAEGTFLSVEFIDETRAKKLCSEPGCL